MKKKKKKKNSSIDSKKKTAAKIVKLPHPTHPSRSRVFEFEAMNRSRDNKKSIQRQMN